MNFFCMTEREEEKKTAEELAEKLGLDIRYEEQDEEDKVLALRMDRDGLALTGDGLELRGDFTRMLSRLKTANLRGELLVRAGKIKEKESDRIPTAVDATAGMGEDSLLLAAAGYSVQLFEYNPVIAALLQDTLRRAKAIPELEEAVNRMRLTQTDSINALKNLDVEPDLILLDPMFPARQKSGLVKKKFQLLQQLEQPCTDEAQLMQAAMAANPSKVIVKRPSKGPYLAGIKPSYSIEGKGIRYDCIVLRTVVDRQ